MKDVLISTLFRLKLKQGQIFALALAAGMNIKEVFAGFAGTG